MSEEITPIIFRVCDGEVTAIFPTEPGTSDIGTASCYAHVGQHGSCSLDWYNSRTRSARPEDYASLKRELEAAPYRYRLKVYRRIQPWMHRARREELRRVS